MNRHLDPARPPNEHLRAALAQYELCRRARASIERLFHTAPLDPVLREHHFASFVFFSAAGELLDAARAAAAAAALSLPASVATQAPHLFQQCLTAIWRSSLALQDLAGGLARLAHLADLEARLRAERQL